MEDACIMDLKNYSKLWGILFSCILCLGMIPGDVAITTITGNYEDYNNITTFDEDCVDNRECR